MTGRLRISLSSSVIPRFSNSSPILPQLKAVMMIWKMTMFAPTMVSVPHPARLHILVIRCQHVYPI